MQRSLYPGGLMILVLLAQWASAMAAPVPGVMKYSLQFSQC